MKRALLPAVAMLAGSLGFAAAGAPRSAAPARRSSSESKGARADWPHDSRGVLLAIAQAPQAARLRPNPYEGRPEAIPAGRKLFRQHCAQCHGPDGRGIGRAANLTMSDVQNATPGELEWLLRNGNLRRGMPDWSGLPIERRWQIIAYLHTLH